MKKVAIVVMIILSVVTAGVAGYNIGYDAAMKEVESNVLDGLEQLNNLFSIKD